MNIHLIASVFAIIFVAELPDKTALASLVLATRHKPLPVFIGASLALTVQSVVAVGGPLARIAGAEVIAGLLLLGSAAVMWMRRSEVKEARTGLQRLSSPGCWARSWSSCSLPSGATSRRSGRQDSPPAPPRPLCFHGRYSGSLECRGYCGVRRPPGVACPRSGDHQARRSRRLCPLWGGPPSRAGCRANGSVSQSEFRTYIRRETDKSTFQGIGRLARLLWEFGRADGNRTRDFVNAHLISASRIRGRRGPSTWLVRPENEPGRGGLWDPTHGLSQRLTLVG
jgi:hypothetical protein